MITTYMTLKSQRQLGPKRNVSYEHEEDVMEMEMATDMGQNSYELLRFNKAFQCE